MKLTGYLLSAIFLLIIGSCNQAYIYENSKSVDSEGWIANDIIQFTVPIDQLEEEFDMFLHLRHDGRYAYSNIFLFIDTYAPTGASIRDTLEFRLADKEGKWFGRGIGGQYTHELAFKHKVMFPYTGNYNIEIQHGMRTERLEHIKDVGISIKRINKSAKAK